MSRRDWTQIKADYVEGTEQGGQIVWPTLREISEQRGVSESTLRKRAAGEDWTTQRNIYRTKLEQQVQEKKTEALASELAEFDTLVIRASRVGVQHILAHFGLANVRWKNRKQPMDLKQLDLLGRALEKFQKTGRLALGESGDELEVKGPLVIVTGEREAPGDGRPGGR